MSTVNLQPSELSNWGTTMIYIYIQEKHPLNIIKHFFFKLMLSPS
jgi:hypothetical protein